MNDYYDYDIFCSPATIFLMVQVKFTKKKNDSIRAKTLNAVNNFQFVLHTLPLRRRLLVDLFRFKTKCDIKFRAIDLFFGSVFYLWKKGKKMADF